MVLFTCSKSRTWVPFVGQLFAGSAPDSSVSRLNIPRSSARLCRLSISRLAKRLFNVGARKHIAGKETQA
jgi:hypothetical protein